MHRASWIRRLFWPCATAVLIALTGCAHTQLPLAADAVGNEVFEIGLPKSLHASHPLPYRFSISGAGPHTRVSLQCQDAPIHSLLVDLLNHCAVPYRVGALRLHGLATLNLQDRPLLEVCGALLRNCEAYAFYETATDPATLCIANRPLTEKGSLPNVPQQSSEQIVTKRVQMKHRDVSSVLQNLLGSSSSEAGLWKDSTEVSVAIHPETNYLYLRGPLGDVERTARLLSHADQVAPMVKVELFLLSRRPQTSSVSQSPSWTLSIDQDAFIRWQPGTPIDEGVGFSAGFNQFNSDVPSAQDKFKWAALHQTLQGRFVGHTELTVLTGQPMLMNVGKTGYALRTTLDSGVPSGQQVQINATTQFQITPKALPSKQISLEINQTNARFAPKEFLSGNIAQRTIDGTIVIPDGGFVILGGSNLHFGQLGLTFPPWLRQVPGVSALLSQFSVTSQDEYVITLVKASLVDRGSLESSLLSLPAIPVCDMPAGLQNIVLED